MPTLLSMPGAAPLVVWWRPPRHRGSGIGSGHVCWLHLTTGQTGTSAIARDRWLDRTGIGHQLERGLSPLFDHAIRVVPAHEVMDYLSPGVRLRVHGRRIVYTDLASSYGMDVRAGITVSAAGDIVVVIEEQLGPAVAADLAGWAEAALSGFDRLTPRQRRERGWTEPSPHRWQLLARHPSATEP